jgi:hypothetical protein
MIAFFKKPLLKLSFDRDNKVNTNGDAGRLSVNPHRHVFSEKKRA